MNDATTDQKSKGPAAVEKPNAATSGAPGAPDRPVQARSFGGAVKDLLATEGVASLFAIAVVAVVFQLQTSLFLSSENISNLLVQCAPLAMVALAQCAVILMKEIDLSLGSMVGVTAAIGATLITNNGETWWVAVILMLAVGAAFGALQGGIIVVGKVPAFVVTLGGYLAFLGIQLNTLGAAGGINVSSDPIQKLTTDKLSHGLGLLIAVLVLLAWIANRAMRIRSAHRTGAAQARPLGLEVVIAAILAIVLVGGTLILNRSGGIPLVFVLVVAIVGLVAAFLHLTAAGRHVYAVGGNPEAARRAGVKVRTLRWAGFITAGVLAACGGLIYLSYDQGASTTTGGGTLLLQAIGAAVIGGVSLFGGRGSVWGAVTGAIVLGGIENGLNLTNQAAPTKYIIEGVVVVLAVLLDSLLRQGFEVRLGSLRRTLGGTRKRRRAGAPRAAELDAR